MPPRGGRPTDNAVGSQKTTILYKASTLFDVTLGWSYWADVVAGMKKGGRANTNTVEGLRNEHKYLDSFSSILRLNLPLPTSFHFRRIAKQLRNRIEHKKPNESTPISNFIPSPPPRVAKWPCSDRPDQLWSREAGCRSERRPALQKVNFSKRLTKTDKKPLLEFATQRMYER